jgi:DNA-binding LacI/PurR family transcriptional regulator
MTLRQPVTSAMLADQLGVSRATVSIVLNGHGPARKISPVTIQRVLDAARDQGYAPNRTARNLRLQKSGVIGVVLADFRMDWAERVMRDMGEVFDPGEYTPLVGTHRWDAVRHRKELMSALQRRDEAVIVQPLPGQDEVYQQLMAVGIPLVFLGDRPPLTASSPVSAASFAGWDSAAAARTAVRHLIERGYRRIGHLGFHHPMHMTQERTAAYRATLHDAGLPAHEEWIRLPPAGGAIEGTIAAEVERLFAPGGEHPDALFVLNDGLALQLLEVLDQKRIRVPQDVAIIGMGDLPLTGHSGISLSTVREPCEEMGRAAAHAALSLIAEPGRAPIVSLIPGNELRARRTTGS